MKKITLTLFTFLLTLTLFGQNYTTGTLNLTTNYTAKVDVNVTTNIVTLTLNGPSDRYFGFGFGVLNMLTNGSDCVIYTGIAGTGMNILSDRTFNGNTSTPSVDSGTNTQSWNVTTNSVSGNTRTLIATRPRVSTGDFTFPTTAGSINFAWSHANSAGYNLVYHGGNRAGITVPYTLGAENFKFETFTMYPNPSKNIVNIDLPNQIESGIVKIYDSLGRIVKNKTVSKTDNQIITEDFATGAYMVVVRTEYGNSTKILLIE
ncbi:MAG: T9SS type A sorting domain-containing protein [Flavobacterium sp.]|nr:T9SS type A sorting domain-containing protein [Flavobacterium sp.]